MMMNRGEESSNSIPIDLITEILSRLPAKSVARFHCVSKLWDSILHRPYFTKLFLTKSWIRRRILFVLRNSKKEWSFYSSPQPHNPYDKSSSFVAADFHMKLPPDIWSEYCSLTNGLVFFHGRWSPKDDKHVTRVICNPNTGRYVILPKLTRKTMGYSSLGFDPVDKQFKVLSLCYPCGNDDRILTLGTGELRWRKIQFPFQEHVSGHICINGVLYYLASLDFGSDDETSYVVICFDVRSEKFKVIPVECYHDSSTRLINYKGKLGLISLKDNVELRMCVLEDVGKQEWSNYFYNLPENKDANLCTYAIVGVTATGEIVFVIHCRSKPFYVFYFNPERNTLQSVEIQGVDGEPSTFYAFVDHVEDLIVNDAKLLESSQGLNIIRKRRKPQQRHTPCDLHNSAPSMKNKPTIVLQNKYESLANLE